MIGEGNGGTGRARPLASHVLRREALCSMLDSLSWVRTPTRSFEMTLSTCPTMIARARAERVWSQLQDPRTYDRWMDAHLVSVTPSGPAEPGQCILLRAPTWGRFFAVRITVHS